MQCEECIFQFKCYTSRRKPRKIVGVSFIINHSCGECQHCAWCGKLVDLCPITNLLVHKESIACNAISLKTYTIGKEKRYKDDLRRIAYRTYDGRPVYCFDTEERKIKPSKRLDNEEKP
jgi:ferredoxin